MKLDGVTSNSWITQDGKAREGKPIDKSLIYKVLNNRTYLGELRHKEQWYQAEHPPIIDRDLWDIAKPARNDSKSILIVSSSIKGHTPKHCVNNKTKPLRCSFQNLYILNHS
ncbi:recombinase family protein [Nitrosomonas communis]|uniref:Recombinase n=1 Tax=Nitrosomonas communis TaxID=44574 RepID=A0A1I4SA10_9PROT|nr:recombinase family protein [Nitrosomonas communis]SFM61357.1 Recombinase [Nitrosomonas communis]